MIRVVVPIHSTTPSNLTWDKNLCDPQIVVLSLGVLCVCVMYVCKFHRETGCIFPKRKLPLKKLKKIRSSAIQQKLWLSDANLFVPYYGKAQRKRNSFGSL